MAQQRVNNNVMEKTVVIVCGNSLSSSYGGPEVVLDHDGGPTKIGKMLWTSCIEAVTEYCRIIFDLFPDEYQVSCILHHQKSFGIGGLLFL